MRSIKSERLKKLETELQDLEQWLKLGLVPKKDIEKHKEEILLIKEKIAEEKERLQFLKESGEMEEFVAPKRSPARTGYTEMPTIPDIDMAETGAGFEETDYGETEETEAEDETTQGVKGAVEEGEEEEEEEEDDVDEESYFSDRNRWRRGGIVDPDANEW